MDLFRTENSMKKKVGKQSKTICNDRSLIIVLRKFAFHAQCQSIEVFFFSLIEIFSVFFHFIDKYLWWLYFLHFAWSIGASMFKAIEGEVNYKFTQDRNVSMAVQRINLTNHLWNITLQLNNFNRSSYINE